MNIFIWRAIFILLAIIFSFSTSIALQRFNRTSNPSSLVVAIFTALLAMAAAVATVAFERTGIELRYTTNILFAFIFLFNTAFALRPFQLLDKLRLQFVYLPPPVANRLKTLKNTLGTNAFISVVLISVHFLGREIPLFLLIFGALYSFSSFITTTLIWMEVAKGLAPPPKHVANWKNTPYDAIDLLSEEEDEKAFDIFISYKSENIHVVRNISDLLLASGLRVWFAEYCVPLTERERFQDAIDFGIRRSKYGIVFTNDLFINSKYCKREIDLLLEPEGPGIENIIEVKIPDEPLTHKRKSEISECPFIEFSDDVNEVLRFIKNQFGLEVEIRSAYEDQNLAPTLYHDSELRFSIDVAGWEQKHEGGTYRPGGKEGPAFRRTLNGYTVEWNLYIGKGVAAPRKFDVGGKGINDRKAYETAIDFAKQYLAHHERRCTGVHLLFLGGFSHLVLTYWMRRCWERRYSVILREPQSEENIEFAFAFGFHGPFQEYCRHAHIMDSMVQSLKWEGKH